jgi:hypothetical protein
MFTIPNLGLSITTGFITIIIISISLTIITYLNNNLEHPVTKEINEAEIKLTTKEYLELYVFRIIHFFSTFTIILLPYIFKPNLYLYFVFIIYVSIAVILWRLIKECPFSIHEKQLLNKEYRNGNNKLEPYLVLSLPSFLVFIISYIYRVNLLVVLFRLFQHYYLPKSQIPKAVRL